MLSNSIRRILIASGFTVATSFMTVLSASANTVTPTAGFTATVNPSVAITTPFSSATAIAYTETPFTTSGSGGVAQLTKTESVVFNSNSNTLSVTAVLTATPSTQASTNATKLAGVHALLIANTTANLASPDSQTITGTNATVTPFKTDPNGNMTLAVTSTWNPSNGGEELLSGTYTAIVALTVVAN